MSSVSAKSYEWQSCERTKVAWTQVVDTVAFKLGSQHLCSRTVFTGDVILLDLKF